MTFFSNFARHKRDYMITLSFPLAIALVVLVYLTILVLLNHFKSPMRKWVCFGLSFIITAYMLSVMMWYHEASSQRLEWFLLGGVAIIAAMMLAGIGFMDMSKPKNISGQNSGSDNESDYDNEPSDEESDYDNEPSNDNNSSYIDNSCDEEQDDGEHHTFDSLLSKYDNDERKKVSLKRVYEWVIEELKNYNEKDLNAIKICVINFLYEKNFWSSSFTKIPKNSNYNQQKLIEICSAFILLDKSREDCASFLKEVFYDDFSNTSKETLQKKIKGKGNMHFIIEEY